MVGRLAGRVTIVARTALSALKSPHPFPDPFVFLHELGSAGRGEAQAGREADGKTVSGAGGR